MYCEQCGHNLEAKHNFCSKCGTPVNRNNNNNNNESANKKVKTNNDVKNEQNNSESNNPENKNFVHENNNEENKQKENTQNTSPNKKQEEEFSGSASPYQEQENNNNYKKEHTDFGQKDFTHLYNQSDIQQNIFQAILSYLGILILIPVFTARNSPFVRFHLNQSIVLILTSFAWGIINSIISSIGIYSMAIFGWFFKLNSLTVPIIIFILLIMGIVYAAQGKAKEIPILGKIKIIK